MLLVLSEQIEEVEYDSLFVIYYTAFSEVAILLAMFPGGLAPSHRAENLVRFKSHLGLEELNTVAAKVIDDRTGDICAFATMRMYDKNPFFPGENSEICLPWMGEDKRAYIEWVLNSRKKRRKDIKELQVPGSYGYLQAVGTSPARQREGAATLLLKWAGKRLDSQGLRGMLEASPAAVRYGLYEKHGFRSVDEQTYVDKDTFTNGEPTTMVIMVRDAKAE